MILKNYFVQYKRTIYSIEVKVVTVSNFRSHLQSYLKYVKKGEQLILTAHDKEIAKVVPANNSSQEAKEKLMKIGKNSKIGDLTSPIDTLWKF